jgi:hypothetical protein
LSRCRQHNAAAELSTPRNIDERPALDAESARNTSQAYARLSTIESAIISCLNDRMGLAVSAKSIVSMVMGRELDEDKAASLLRPHISRLRSKLEQMPQMPQHLLTVRGKGSSRRAQGRPFGRPNSFSSHTARWQRLAAPGFPLRRPSSLIQSSTLEAESFQTTSTHARPRNSSGAASAAG